jgi:hypothetical protein
MFLWGDEVQGPKLVGGIAAITSEDGTIVASDGDSGGSERGDTA